MTRPIINTPRSERLCKFCNLCVLENEYHFLLVCPLCRYIRQKYFNSYYFHWPILNKFENLMSVKSKCAINNIATQLRTATIIE